MQTQEARQPGKGKERNRKKEDEPRTTGRMGDFICMRAPQRSPCGCLSLYMCGCVCILGEECACLCVCVWGMELGTVTLFVSKAIKRVVPHHVYATVTAENSNEVMRKKSTNKFVFFYVSFLFKTLFGRNFSLSRSL